MDDTTGTLLFNSGGVDISDEASPTLWHILFTTTPQGDWGSIVCVRFVFRTYISKRMVLDHDAYSIRFLDYVGCELSNLVHALGGT